MKPLSAPLLSRSIPVLLLLAALSGCNRSQTSAPPVAASAPAAPAAAPAPAAVAVSGEEVIEAAPPPPQEEVMVASPGPDFVWVGGYWGWSGGRHSWMAGHWERPPHVRAEWVQPRWEHRGRGYVFVRGFWR